MGCGTCTDIAVSLGTATLAINGGGNGLRFTMFLLCTRNVSDLEARLFMGNGVCIKNNLTFAMIIYIIFMYTPSSQHIEQKTCHAPPPFGSELYIVQRGQCMMSPP